MKYWYQAERGELEPFVLVVEGSIPNEKIKRRGLLGGAGHRPGYRPADHDQRMDRPARAEGAGRRRRTAPAPPTAASTRWRAIPTGCMGLADYLGWDWKSKAGLPIVNVPGCPVQPDNFMETLLYLLYQLAGLAPMIPLDDQLSARRGCSARPSTKAATAPAITSRAISPRSTARPSASSSSAAGGRWSTATSPSAAGWRASAAARTSAASASAARCRASPTSSCRSWTSRPAAGSPPARSGSTAAAIRRCAADHQRHAQQRAEVAAQPSPS